VQELPNKPGVYLMKDVQGKTLYVGKASSLKKRVASYFQSGKKMLPHTLRLINEINDLETILTDSEMEALILENNMIKRYQPKYNIRLKDAKSYPFVRISKQERFPRFLITRNIVNDGSIYFGPYTDVKSLRRTLQFVRKIFQVANCKIIINAKRSRACIEYQIEKCAAPCIGQISEEEYNELVKAVINILEGKHHSLTLDIIQKIKDASAINAFEKAAAYRDQLRMVENIVQKQKIVSIGGGNKDVIAIEKSGDKASAQVFLIRDGILLDRKQFIIQTMLETEYDEILSEFLMQYYVDAKHIPQEIMLKSLPKDSEDIKKWLSGKGKFKLKKAASKQEKDLLKMVHRNAVLFLDQKMGSTSMKTGLQLESIKELQTVLGLDNPPNRIEGFDVSNISGLFAVGSMVVFKNAEPVKSEYRKFRIKTVKGSDDYLMMKEIVTRRYRRLQDLGSHLPDLVLIDGGKGHLRLAEESLKELGITNLSIMALAKGEEKIYASNIRLPLILERSSKALLLVQYIRDEAHRFAIQYHKILRRKGMSESELDLIPGIGISRKKILLKHFGNVKVIRKTGVDEISNVHGISQALAQEIYDFFKNRGRTAFRIN
jgi:excinuclease ABC subunit C